MGMSESLFARLDNANNTVLLKLQYRMNKKIMSIANHMTYQGNLKAGNSLVETATLEFTDPMVMIRIRVFEEWFLRTYEHRCWYKKLSTFLQMVAFMIAKQSPSPQLR